MIPYLIIFFILGICQAIIRRQTENGNSKIISVNVRVYVSVCNILCLLQVHLKKGFSLMVPKGAKAKLLVDTKSRKSATRFLRKTLTEVYGASQLAQMTAKGRYDGSLGISDSDLAALYGECGENDHSPSIILKAFLCALLSIVGIFFNSLILCLIRFCCWICRRLWTRMAQVHWNNKQEVQLAQVTQQQHQDNQTQVCCIWLWWRDSRQTGQTKL